MASPTLLPILGSVIAGDISKSGGDGLLTVITTTGFVITFSRNDLQANQVVQASSDPSQTLYRLFVSPSATLSVKLEASAWAAMDAANDALRAQPLNSGASKHIEDTA